MTDRDLVMSRRRALMLAAAATTTTGCPSVCLSVAQPCLSVARMRSCEGLEFVFDGASTTLDAAALSVADELAKRIQEQGVSGSLSVFVFDDGQTSAATTLHGPRLDAVRSALIQRGVPEGNVAAGPVDATPLTSEAWLQHTGNGNPLPLSGLVTIDC